MNQMMDDRKDLKRIWIISVAALSLTARADDWPQWMGPQRDGVWRGTPKNALYSGTATPFIEGEAIYGCDADSGALTCIRLSDGERLWQTTVPTTGSARKGRYGTAFLVKHEDRFFLFNEQGDLILAKLSPQGYEELGRFHVLEPTSTTFGRAMVWSHPAFAQKCLFARNDKELVCVDLAAPGR